MNVLASELQTGRLTTTHAHTQYSIHASYQYVHPRGIGLNSTTTALVDVDV